jgi:NTP pyrophosphatase (non-canonical NTP hydrolase)
MNLALEIDARALPMAKVFQAVMAERNRQDAKWGEQNHHPFLWLAILGEEVGEVNKAALQATFGGKTWADYRKELIETAAVAIAMVECLDRHGGAPPAAAPDAGTEGA